MVEPIAGVRWRAAQPASVLMRLDTLSMNPLLNLATQLGLVVACGFAASAAAQARPGVSQPRLMPGCALPSAKLMAAAAPLDVELVLGVAPSGDVVNVAMRRGSGDDALDAAFVAAARACRFTSAAGAGAEPAPQRQHTLAFQYAGGRSSRGFFGCFPTGYPAVARRLDEEGTTGIAFMVPATDAPAQVKLTQSAHSRSLDSEALLIASSCLANPSVRGEWEPDRWYHQPIKWVLQ